MGHSGSEFYDVEKDCCNFGQEFVILGGMFVIGRDVCGCCASGLLFDDFGIDVADVCECCDYFTDVSYVWDSCTDVCEFGDCGINVCDLGGYGFDLCDVGDHGSDV